MRKLMIDNFNVTIIEIPKCPVHCKYLIKKKRKDCILSE